MPVGRLQPTGSVPSGSSPCRGTVGSVDSCGGTPSRAAAFFTDLTRTLGRHKIVHAGDPAKGHHIDAGTTAATDGAYGVLGTKGPAVLMVRWMGAVLVPRMPGRAATGPVR